MFALNILILMKHRHVLPLLVGLRRHPAVADQHGHQERCLSLYKIHCEEGEEPSRGVSKAD